LPDEEMGNLNGFVRIFPDCPPGFIVIRCKCIRAPFGLEEIFCSSKNLRSSFLEVPISLLLEIKAGSIIHKAKGAINEK
jgi:hypothetical protein